MDREPGKGTQGRCLVMWPSVAAVNPAHTRHREPILKAASWPCQSTAGGYDGENINEQSHLILSWVCSQHCYQPGLHWRLGLTSPVPHWCFLLARRFWAGSEDPWSMQAAEAMAHQPHSSLVPVPDFTPVKAVTSNIFPKDCTHLPDVLLEMVNYCIHKNVSKWEV